MDYVNDDVLDSFLLRAKNLRVRSRQQVLPPYNSGHNFLSTMWRTHPRRICSVSQNSVGTTWLMAGHLPACLPLPHKASLEAACKLLIFNNRVPDIVLFNHESYWPNLKPMKLILREFSRKRIPVSPRSCGLEEVLESGRDHSQSWHITITWKLNELSFKKNDQTDAFSRGYISGRAAMVIVG